MHHRKESRRLARSAKVVERLLLYTNGKSEGVGDGYLAGSVLHISSDRAYVRDQELTLRVVVLMIPGAAGEQQPSLHAPPRGAPHPNSPSHNKSLRELV